ncbi:MAG TPA: metallophosphoesterase [Burkholderiaceae bacterium]|nr:metallophosphoesterase [Burkholderiaceae bacterium]
MAQEVEASGGAEKDQDGEAARSLVTFRLDMEPREFAQQQFEFVDKLARAVDLPQSDIEILGYRPGCVNVDVVMPSVAAKEIEAKQRDGTDLSPAAAEFLRSLRVTKITPQGAPFSEAVINVRRPGREFTWLHLSDIHLQDAAGSDRYPQDEVREKFLERVSVCMADFDLRPDVVFVTGDVTQSAEPTQFDVALRFLQDLRAALPNQNAPVMLVPGNHDVFRGAITDDPADLANEERARKELKGHLMVRDLLQNPAQKPWRDSLFKRTGNADAFLKQIASLGQPARNHEFFFTTVFEHEEAKIGVAGLNSAWRSSHLGDRYHLMLTSQQMDTALKDLRSAHLRIALVHHPVQTDWFEVNDAARQRLVLDAFHFVLRGHEHDPHVLAIGTGEGDQIRIAAGALYSHDDYPNSFNAVRVNLDWGTAAAYFWRFSERNLEWVIDTENFPRLGSRQFALPLTARERLGVSSAEPAQVVQRQASR